MKKIMFNDNFLLTKAVLEGRKTQTRRIIPQDFFSLVWDKRDDTLVYENGMGDFIDIRDSRYAQYKVGDVVAVAQNYCAIADELENSDNATCAAHYEKNVEKASEYISWMEHPGFYNKMFISADMMIHRIRITDVRVEKLQDISAEDCLKEGLEWDAKAQKYYAGYMKETEKKYWLGSTLHEAFAHLINKVSRKDMWSLDPYVFVYDFKLVK